MPIYDYKCNQCGKTSELFFRGTDIGEVSCPQCGGNSMERLPSASYAIRMGSQAPGTTCCGRAERCDSAESSGGRSCCGSG